MTLLVVSDLRQYAYCPRIVFYRYCWPDVRPTTYLMEAGKEAHEDEAGREQRRGLRAYGLTDGERSFDVWLEDEALGVCGKLDMAIAQDGEVIPVEHKNSPGRMGRHVTLQLAAYGVLLSRAAGIPVTRGFVYHIPQRKAREILLPLDLQQETLGLLGVIRWMVVEERMPPPTAARERCGICEFHRFCNDVI